MMRLYAVAAVVALVFPSVAAAQDGGSGSTDAVDRPLATRQELQSQLQREGTSGTAARIKERLAQGDFRNGDRIALMVQGEKDLTDTFTVASGGELLLPPPTVGSLSLKGVLRSELQSKMVEYISRFRTNAVVRAQPLLRLSVQGEVNKGGVYAVPADGQLADALMAAGGTTQYAKANKVTIQRNGEKVWEGSAVNTELDALKLRDGDQITVGSSRPKDSMLSLRTAGLLVSMAVGLYTLSRAMHR
jgi:polysaccharide export outer membrane protein